MRLLPERHLDLISFAQLHAAAWSVAPSAIGLSAQQAAQVAADAQAARDGQMQVDQLKMALRNAVSAQNVRLNHLRTSLASSVASIRAFATVSAEPMAVYTQAKLLPAQPASPAPAPGTPTSIAAKLESSGALTLTWKSNNPRGTQGTSYIVRRGVGEHGAMEYLGTTGKKTFSDTTIPTGTAQVRYTLQAVRGQKMSPPMAPVIVQFGTRAAEETLTIRAAA